MVHSGVLGVAACAVVAARTGFHLQSVVAALSFQTATDFLMAIKTSELLRAGAEHVAFGALERSFKIAVRFAERAGRHLGRHLTCRPAAQQHHVYPIPN